MFNLNNLNFAIFYFLNYFAIPYDKIILINKKKNNKYIKLNFILIYLYNLLIFLSKINFIKIYLNRLFFDYKVIYKKNDKFKISDSFIIKEEKTPLEKLSCSNIKRIIFIDSDNYEVNLLNKIKEYDLDFNIYDFLKINNINQDNIKKIIIEYIPIFDITNKELNFNEIKLEKIKYLLKN
tara:strand:- start:370 stop:909 length:540 start_codon:yes stop_codon:yes gene_type:complete